MRRLGLYPLRRILAPSLVLTVTAPAFLSGWTIACGTNASVENLGSKIVTQVAVLVQYRLESQLRQAHEVLNGRLPKRLNAADTKRAHASLREPTRLEPLAFALTLRSPDVPVLHFANLPGEYFGVDATAEGVKLAVHGRNGRGCQFHSVCELGNRSKLLMAELGSSAPHSTVWYREAPQVRERVFSLVRISAAGQELVISLFQAVFDLDRGAAGVFPTNLHLRHLAEVLRTQRISGHGGTLFDDDKCAVVASSAGDLFNADAGRFERRRLAFAAQQFGRGEVPTASGSRFLRQRLSCLHSATWIRRA